MSVDRFEGAYRAIHGRLWRALFAYRGSAFVAACRRALAEPGTPGPGGEGECGPLDPSRVLEPEVDYRTDAVAISVAVAVWDRGPQIAPAICSPPTEVRVRLDEPPDGRPLVAGD